MSFLLAGETEREVTTKILIDPADYFITVRSLSDAGMHAAVKVAPARLLRELSRITCPHTATSHLPALPVPPETIFNVMEKF
jgi:malonyl CoA-acyl carrier protein transacylase